jgi:hypothetical protein
MQGSPQTILPRLARRIESAVVRESARVRVEMGLAESTAVADRLAALERRSDDVERRLKDVQALGGRAYEALFDWPAMLEALRSEPRYDEPWSDPEPLITVRIATYNNAAQLCARALASLRRQTYERWEAVVVGDAVTDDTEARIEKIGDPRIRFINLPFRGPYPDDPKARWRIAGTAPSNRGLDEARGAWIAPLDHDDEFTDDHVEVLLRHAQETRAELVYGKLRVVDEASGRTVPTPLGVWPPRLGQFGFQGALHHSALRRFHYSLHATLLEEPGDWNLARRLWEAGVRFAFLDQVVTRYYFTPVGEEGKAWIAAALRED